MGPSRAPGQQEVELNPLKLPDRAAGFNPAAYFPEKVGPENVSWNMLCNVQGKYCAFRLKADNVKHTCCRRALECCYGVGKANYVAQR